MKYFHLNKARERTKGATSKHVLSISNKSIQNRWNIKRRTKPTSSQPFPFFPSLSQDRILYDSN